MKNVQTCFTLKFHKKLQDFHLKTSLIVWNSDATFIIQKVHKHRHEYNMSNTFVNSIKSNEKIQNEFSLSNCCIDKLNFPRKLHIIYK